MSSEPYVTRDDQLGLKPEKPRGRGRGPGRGRGRTTTKQKGSGKGSHKEAPEKDEKDEGWWEEEWYNEYGPPDEEWAHESWGTSGYHWDAYAWNDGNESLGKLKDVEEQQTKKKAKKFAKPVAEPTGQSTGNETKQRKRTTEIQKTEPQKKARKAERPTSQEPDALPRDKDVPKIRKYLELYADNPATSVTEEMKVEMKTRLKVSNLQQCRLNIYWKTGRVGCTSRSAKRDLCSFSFNDIDGPNFMSRLAVALKCAKLFVT
jgi:hypothetical protein